MTLIGVRWDAAVVSFNTRLCLGLSTELNPRGTRSSTSLVSEGRTRTSVRAPPWLILYRPPERVPAEKLSSRVVSRKFKERRTQ